MPEILLIFSDEKFIIHGHGSLGKPGLMWLHLVSDLIIAFSFFSISLLLAYFLWQNPTTKLRSNVSVPGWEMEVSGMSETWDDILFQRILWLFCAFIIACGFTHLMAVWTLWHPDYWLSSLFKALTAGVSFYTAQEMVQLIPKQNLPIPPGRPPDLGLVLSSFAQLARGNRALTPEILEQRQTHSELPELTQRLSLLVQQTPLAVIEWTLNFEVADWNPAAEKIFGYSKREALGRHAVELMVPESAKEQVNQVWKQLLLQQGGTRSTNTNFTKEGREIYCEWYNTPLIDAEGQVIGVASLVQDITQRKSALLALQQAKNELEVRVEARTQELKQALVELNEVIAQLQSEIEQRQQVEAALIEREEQYRSVVDNVKEVIFQMDAKGLWIFLNPAWSEITGFAIADSLGHLFLDYVHPEDRQRSREEFRPLIEGKKEYCRHEVRYLTRSGGYRWIEVLAQLTVDADGIIIGTCGTLNDITERHLSEAALKASEDRYRAIVEEQTELICRFLPDGTLTFVNEAYARNVAQPPEAIVGCNFMSLIPAEEWQATKKYLGSLNQENPVGRYEHRVILPSGEIRWQQWNDRAIFDEAGCLMEFQSVGRDITERKQAEITLAKRERYLAVLVEVQRRLLAFEGDTEYGLFDLTSYTEILGLLGKVSSASRVYLFENHYPHSPLEGEKAEDATSDLFMSQRAEWCAPGIQPEICNPNLQNLSYDNFFPRWAQLLSQDQIIAGVVAEFPESERVVLELQGIFSILILPLTVNGKFFGFIGFDNCTEARDWEPLEVDLLRAAAAAVSLWYESFLAQKALRQSEATNRALLEAIPDALLRISRDGTYLDFIPAKNLQTLIPTHEFLGKKVSEVLPPEFALKITEDVEATLRTGKVQVSEETLRFNDEQHHYESRTVFYSKDEVLTIVRDVTERKQAEAALRESEERFRSLVDHIPGVVYRCGYDANRTTEFISDAIEEISGYCASDFLGNQVRSYTSLIVPQDLARVEQVVLECIAQRRPYMIEYRLIRKDGSVRWLYEKGQGVFGTDGSLLWLDGVIFDITEGKRTQEELRSREEQFRQLTENIHEVFFLTAPDFSQMLYVSPAYEDVWGRPRNSLYEQPSSWLDAVYPKDRDAIALALRQYLQQEQDFEQEYRIVRPDGIVRWVWVRAFFVRNERGVPTRLAGIAEDITERKRAQAEILNALAKEKELGDLKSRFISITSHEFRTPLTTIMSTTELLEYYEWTKEEELEQLHLIQDAVRQMLQLLEDVLFIGTADAGQLRFNPAPLDLDKFCRELVAEIQRGLSLNSTPTGTQHTIIFTSSHQPFLVCMDKKLLRQLLSNLLLNAIKYSPAGGTVQFELASQGDKAIFQIQDQGIGIPREDQPRLFEFFHRAKNVGAIAGTGLGLAIVKKCVDSHDGHITVNSEVGVGTRFTITLPKKR